MFLIDPVISSLLGYTSTNGSSINSTLAIGGRSSLIFTILSFSIAS